MLAAAEDQVLSVLGLSWDGVPVGDRTSANSAYHSGFRRSLFHPFLLNEKFSVLKGNRHNFFF